MDRSNEAYAGARPGLGHLQSEAGHPGRPRVEITEAGRTLLAAIEKPATAPPTEETPADESTYSTSYFGAAASAQRQQTSRLASPAAATCSIVPPAGFSSWGPPGVKKFLPTAA